MSTRYHHDHKAAVMIMLERNRGDIRTTSHQTGVPINTLRGWQNDISPYLSSSDTPSARQLAETPVFTNDLEALSFIRQNIIAEISRLSASLQYDAGFSTPYQRALVLSQLMDKLMKLDLHLKPYAPSEPQKIRIEFVDEQGNIHDKLPDSDDEDDEPVKFRISGDPEEMYHEDYYKEDDIPEME